MPHPFSDRPLRLGTRASPLAMAQAMLAKTALITAHGWADTAVELVPLVAAGDRIQDRALADVGGKALWTRELDAALIAGRIDAAVHSMKDVETIRPEAFVIAALLPRADVRDRLVGADSIADLPQGATIGTASPRRTAQLLRMRPDLKVVLLRGNVGTRLAKIARGEAAATLLAAAGLDRLDMAGIGVAIAVDQLLPAPAQGAVGIEVLADHAAVRSLVSAINDDAACRCVMAERELLAELGGDCRSPVAALAVVEPGGAIRLRAALYAVDGADMVAGDVLLSDQDTPVTLAQMLLTAAAPSIRSLFAG